MLSKKERRIDILGNIPFLLVHFGCVLVFWAGFSWAAIIACFLLWFIRMFGITAGYHRYFSHRSYKTSRVFQFFLAVLGNAAAQLGPLWWAACHRTHHQHSDTDKDIHSPVLDGFLWSHVGWVLSPYYTETKQSKIRDFSMYPELRYLDRFHQVIPIVLALLLVVLGQFLQQYAPQLETNGLQMLIWGFCISTTLLYHSTFTINSLAHVFGGRRFDTKDESRNNFFLALITLGEGWHNNHHYYPASASQGFYWWEIDITLYLLKILSWVGIVWDLKSPPKRVYSKTYQSRT